MNYKQGDDRQVYLLFPPCIDEYVEKDSPVRVIDRLVDRLDMVALGFNHTSDYEKGGRPPYDPKDMMKLYIYGYFNSIRTSRKLERECLRNIEVMWLLRKLAPDHDTIASFRKENAKAIKKAFKAVNGELAKMDLFSKTDVSIDGSKFKAVNAKDNNFTLNKLDDRLARLEQHEEEYLRMLDENDFGGDRQLTKEEIEHKIAVLQERKERYEAYRDQLEQTGESQLSTTDPDARLMKTNDGFGVAYNVQTGVDAKNHLIAGYVVTNEPTDHGQITEISKEIKEDFGSDKLEAVTDKGYQDKDDMAEALENGIVPNVIQIDGSDTVEVEFEYVDENITAETIESNSPADIRACLRSGQIPAMYDGVLSDPCVVEKKVYGCPEGSDDSEILKMTPEQMIAKAKEGYYVRDAARNLVYCPEGNILRPKSVKKNGQIRYCNKLACKNCKNKCTTSLFKEADFDKDILIGRCVKIWSKKRKDNPGDQLHNRKRLVKVIKKVVYTLHLNTAKMNQRKCLSEHPFGTIKRTLNAYYFLMKSIVSVEAEMALSCISYNLRRAMNILSVNGMMLQMA